jgi:uncharacterized protein YkwD
LGGFIVFLAACLFFGLLAAAEPTRGLPSATPEADTLTIPTTTIPDTQNSQQTLLDLINSERTKAGLKLLQWDDRLAEAARDHAAIMSRQGRLSHQFQGEPDLLQRLSLRSIRLDAASENVVYDVSVEGAHSAFSHSPRHMGNMLNAAYDGVGIAVINLHGILYVVEDFAHRITDLNDDDAARRVAERFADLREQSGLPPLEFVGNSRVQALVEQMAVRESLDSHAPLSLPGARFAASYATVDLDGIPATVAHLASLRGAATCAVGVRFARTPRYPSGLFWVSIVMFDHGASLARK